MWTKITDIAKTAAAMLQNGKVPPNTPAAHYEDLSKLNFLASKKFFVVFCSVLIISVYFGAGTVVLFLTAPFPLLTPAFVTMFVEVLKVFVIIIGAFLSLQTTLDYKMNSNTNVEQRNDTMNSYAKEDITQHIIEEGQPGAPEIRPYSTLANEEE